MSGRACCRLLGKNASFINGSSPEKSLGQALRKESIGHCDIRATLRDGMVKLILSLMIDVKLANFKSDIFLTFAALNSGRVMLCL